MKHLKSFKSFLPSKNQIGYKLKIINSLAINKKRQQKQKED